ncbi:hypothetical protein ACFQY0_05040 [Haloferula chungangensis]|uniref:Anti-sigma factor n=1 Tax=Haloferula chungangensis TaxID=1048331 RepID=A0ABW2L4L8_9BACT
MDKEEARFILRCFRPDGSDAAEPEFAEALQFAAADRDLGDWLAKERAQDAEFSSMLGRLPLPEGLREEILAGLAAERGDLPQADEIDAVLIGGLAMISPPRGLRDEIVEAMGRSVPNTNPSGSTNRSSSWWRFGVPLAAAAGIALAFMVQSEPPAENSGPLVSISDAATSDSTGSAVPVSFVEDQAIATLESPDFALDLKNPDQKALFKFIRGKGRACPSGGVPRKLEAEPSIGCRVIEVNGKPGAIVCLRRGEGEVVHLVVFRRDDVLGDLPSSGHPLINKHGQWAVAHWEKGNRAFMLLGRTDTEHLEELF